MHYTEQASNMPFTAWLGERHLNTMSDSCLPKLGGEMLLSHSAVWPKQLNMKILILMFLWPILVTKVV